MTTDQLHPGVVPALNETDGRTPPPGGLPGNDLAVESGQFVDPRFRSTPFSYDPSGLAAGAYVADGRTPHPVRTIVLDNQSTTTFHLRSGEVDFAIPPSVLNWSKVLPRPIQQWSIYVDPNSATPAGSASQKLWLIAHERQFSPGASNTSGAGSSSSITAPIGQKAMAASVSVAVASDQSAVPISAAALPLPTGAATEAGNLATIAGRLGTLGQQNMAGSAPVVIASNQSAVPITNSQGGNTQAVDADSKAYVVDLAAINVANGQQTSTATAATLLVARATRKRATIRNLDAANSVWLGVATVTTGNGILLKAGESRDYFGKALLQIIDNGAHAAVDYVDYYD